MTDYKAIRKDLYERFHDAFEKLYVSELKDQIADKDEVITAQDHMIAEQKAVIDQNRIDLEEYSLDVKRLEAALRNIKWQSADKDNMEFAALITYSQMDAIRAALGEASFTEGHCKDKKAPGGCQLHNLQCSYPDCDRRPVGDQR